MKSLILMLDSSNKPIDFNLGLKLFLNLPNQGLHGSLASFDLPSRELPLQTDFTFIRSFCNEKLTFFHYCSTDNFYLFHNWKLSMKHSYYPRRVSDCLKNFISKNKIKKSMVDKLIPCYPLRTYKAIYDMELVNAFA